MWPLIGAAAAGLGGLFSHQSSGSNYPAVAPQYANLRDTIMRSIFQRLNSPTGVPAGYETQGLQAINRSFRNAQMQNENDLSARGLARSPIASAVTARGNNARAAAVGQFRSNIPLVARDLQNQDLGIASNFFQTGVGNQSQQSYGGGPAASFENLAGMIGYLMATGQLGKSGSGGGGGGTTTNTILTSPWFSF